MSHERLGLPTQAPGDGVGLQVHREQEMIPFQTICIVCTAEARCCGLCGKCHSVKLFDPQLARGLRIAFVRAWLRMEGLL